MNRRRFFEIAALLLPFLGLSALWANTHMMAQRGILWDVPIQGYDPRDLLRGHYVRYSYDWPGLSAEEAGQIGYSGAALCIIGNPPVVQKVTIGADPDCSHPLRAASGTTSEIRGLETGILYVSQERGLALEKKLADRRLQGFIRLRVRDDGVSTPVDISFRPRPVQP